MRQAIPFSILLLAAAALPAQPRSAAAQVENGAQLYRMNCVGCHGADGDQVAGVDIGHGVFRRASSDADLVRIITTGIAGTPMPPANYSAAQAAALVAYLRSRAGTPAIPSALGEPLSGPAPEVPRAHPPRRPGTAQLADLFRLPDEPALQHPRRDQPGQRHEP